MVLLEFQVLYTYPGNFRALKALVAAGYSGADVTVDPAFSFGTTNKTQEFLKKFPLGKVSILLDLINGIFVAVVSIRHRHKTIELGSKTSFDLPHVQIADCNSITGIALKRANIETFWDG